MPTQLSLHSNQSLSVVVKALRTSILPPFFWLFVDISGFETPEMLIRQGEKGNNRMHRSNARKEWLNAYKIVDKTIVKNRQYCDRKCEF
jgi:hypothetical protein